MQRWSLPWMNRFMPERFEVEVTFDRQRGYVANHPDLPVITALSLRLLRRRIDERLIGEDVDVRMMLDRAARAERDARRASGGFGAGLLLRKNGSPAAF
jgi:hypothetical protein